MVNLGLTRLGSVGRTMIVTSCLKYNMEQQKMGWQGSHLMHLVFIPFLLLCITQCATSIEHAKIFVCPTCKRREKTMIGLFSTCQAEEYAPHKALEF